MFGKRILLTLLIIITVVVAGIFLTGSLPGRKVTRLKTPSSVASNALPNALPVALDVAASSQEKTVDSANGSSKLGMRVSKSSTAKTYTFFVTDNTSKNERNVFSKTVSPQATMTIPDNAWSPDGKYALVQDNENGTTTSFVFKTSGESFANGQQSLTIEPQFKGRENGLNIIEVTGWAGPTLVIVKTVTDQNTKGPLFWFDIDSSSFIQLAR